MSNNIFSKSPDFKSEYSCCVTRIGELIPVEGSDFLAKTLIQGTQIIVRKDSFTEGDIVLYASNETQLNERFLSLNNLFEIGCRDMNANADEVNAIMKPYLDTKPQIEDLKEKAKRVKSGINAVTNKSIKLKKNIKKLTAKLKELEEGSEQYNITLGALQTDQKTDEGYQETIKEKEAKYSELKAKAAELVKAGEPIVDEVKKLCGFFNKHGRVRCIVLRNEPSFGFIFSLESLQKFVPTVTKEDLEDYLDQEFDTVNGELFCKVFIPPVLEERRKKNKAAKKAEKKLNEFDRLIEGQFKFHYETDQFQKNVHKFSPNDNLLISNKLHGTSGIFANVLVREPRKLFFIKCWINKLMVLLKKPKVFVDYDEVYGPIYSSRRCIKSQYINENVGKGYYDADIWTEYGDIVFPYIDEGMTVYGEIFGYQTDSEKMIQPHYDYGCEVGKNKFMPYRITTKLYNGELREWEVDEVRDWTEKLINRMREKNDPNADRIFPIQIFYHGTLADLYPELDTTEHWHENVLEAMKNDKEHFGMEMDEPLCKAYKVPREGICIRKEGDKIAETFKLKCQRFLVKESESITKGEYYDMEVIEG